MASVHSLGDRSRGGDLQHTKFYDRKVCRWFDLALVDEETQG